MARLLVIAASFAALALPLDAGASSVIAFDRTSAQPNERVKVTSALSVPLRLYLVRQDVARRVTSRTDRRLSFIGVVKPNRSLTFSVPPLDAGTYRLAIWNNVAGLRTTGARLGLRQTTGCSVTQPNGNRPPNQVGALWYGNGHLWAGVEADGTYAASRDRIAADGSIFNKLAWVTSPRWAEPSISGVRIDAKAPPLRVLAVNQGYSSSSPDPSYASAVRFPTPGCWRLTARVGDVSLTYVVRVAVEG